MEIRYINHEDNLTEIGKIYEKSWKSTYNGILPNNYLNSLTEAQWTAKITECGSNSLIMLNNGKYIGTVSFGTSRINQFNGWAEIFTFYLLPEFTGQGLGKKLMNHVAEELKSLGFSQIFLFVLENNHTAIRFYEKYGFKSNGVLMKNKFGKKIVTECMYVYNLA